MNLATLALVLGVSIAHSQPTNEPDVHGALAAKIADPELRDVTQQLLRRMNTDYEALAKLGLTEKGERFDHARVEVTGVGSSDNTYKFNQTDFDRQIKPSFTVEERGLPAMMMRGIKRIYDFTFPTFDPTPSFERMHDSLEFERAAAGETTDRAKEVLAPYKDKEINEIVAHSWGTELVYAAILNGELRPPKKLIVVGVPDDDYAKWRLLAARTGTEVHWVRSENDQIARVGAAVAKRHFPVDYEAKWAALCSGAKTKRNCHAHGRESKPVTWEPIENNPGAAGHDREEYYALLKKNDVLKGTVHQLRAAETAVKEAEIRIVKKAALEAALHEARGLIAKAREQARIARLEREEREQNARVEAERQKFEDAFAESRRELARVDEAHELLRRSLQPSRPAYSSAYVPPPPFSRAFPQMKAFAVAACRAPEEVPIDMFLMPYYNFSYKAFDDDLAARLASDLGDCPRRLFYRLIELLRVYDWRPTDRRWIRSTVAAFSAVPGHSSGNYSSPSSGSRGGGGAAVTPPPTHDPEGEALEQLREIERRKRWGLRPVL